MSADELNSDITADEAARWWAVPEFREYRAQRKFRTNQCDPWPSDAELIAEFEASQLGDAWQARVLSRISHISREGDRFHVDARGLQDASGADVEFDGPRARITINGATYIKLTQIQTEELGAWLSERSSAPSV